MGEARKVASVANDQSKEQEGGSGSTEKRKVHFATLMDICSSQTCSVGTSRKKSWMSEQGYQDAQDKQQTQHLSTQVKMEDAPRLQKFQSQSVRI